MIISSLCFVHRDSIREARAEKYMYTHYYEIGDIILSDQILSLHKRDTNEPELLADRVLHRITFRLSNIGKPTWCQTYNNIDKLNRSKGETIHA